MKPEFKGSKAFLMIPTSIAHDQELLEKCPKAILLLGEIVSMLNVTGEFYINNANLAKRLRCSSRTVVRYLEILEEKELISRENIKDASGNIAYRKIHAGKQLGQAFSKGWEDSTPDVMDVTPHDTRDRSLMTQGDMTPMTHVSPKKNNNNRTINKTIYRSNDQLLEERFEKIWSEYPRKQGKKDALRHYKAWIKASSNHTDEYLLDKLEKYKAYLKANNTELRYVQKGSTWFNGSFDDDWSIKPNRNYSNYSQPAELPPEAFDTKALGVKEEDLPF